MGSLEPIGNELGICVELEVDIDLAKFFDTVASDAFVTVYNVSSMRYRPKVTGTIKKS